MIKTRINKAIAAILLVLSAGVAGAAQSSSGDEGYVIFVSQRNGAAELYLLDLKSRQVSQLTNTGRSHISPAISRNSRMLVYAAREGASYELFSAVIGSAWRTRRPILTGISRLTINPMDEFSPSLTIDGGMMAFSSGYGIEMMSSNGAGRHLVLPNAGGYNDFNPSISPDGSSVAFVSNRTGPYEIWLFTKSTGEVRQVTSGAAVTGGLAWSADSKQIVFSTIATNSRLGGIAIAGVDGGGYRVLTEGNDSSPSLSPSGDRLLFTSTRDGDPEIYMLTIADGKIERLTNSMGVDDGAIFIPETSSQPRQRLEIRRQ